MAIENTTHTPNLAEQAPKKKLLSFSNLTTALLICFALAMVFIPDFKGWTMQSLMKVGLFQPDIPENLSHIQDSNTSSTDKINTSSNQTTIPDVAFLDGAKNTIKLSELKGKVVFLNFWATWCPPCIAEMPAIQKLYNQFKDNKNVQFLLVDADGNYAKSSAFMKKKELLCRFSYLPQPSLMSIFQVPYPPLLYWTKPEESFSHIQGPLITAIPKSLNSSINS